ncbi:Hypothetical protein L21SP2_2574 [Salinispira pacifica]|uniref:Uncharacterized protein n=2 Tax=Salinispira pacifica TaxID=1307761 RepID=V5WL54_9SPIO|nr:Hypothetical protein L21SP2_2574 [Salinispira pacifica]
MLAAAAVLFAAMGALAYSGSVVQIPEKASALELVILISLSLGIMSFLFGMITSDYSWVDRLWSTAPVLFAWIYALKADFSPIVLLPVIVVSLWGARLTFNFARRGGYSGMEDYRWPILRKRIGNEWLWQLFNLLFICGFQIGLFILFTSPLAPLSRMSAAVSGSVSDLFTAIPPAGYAALAAMLFFIGLETVADQQQWDFHKAKALSKAAKTPVAGKTTGAGKPREEDAQWLAAYPWKDDISQGFLSSGLFSIIRHPNYLGELGVWWSLYLFSAAVQATLFHWSISGAVLLSVLFVGSTAFTEGITASKYPEYERFQASTPALIPLNLKGGSSAAREDS